MARDFTRVQEFYLQLHELQPPSTHYHHTYDLAQSNACATPAYEVTAGGGCADVGAMGAAPPHLAALTLPDPCKRKPTQYNSDGYEMSNCGNTLHPHGAGGTTRKRKPSSYSDGFEMSCDESVHNSSLHSPCNDTRKRKAPSYGTASAYDDDGTEDSRSTRTLPDKKQNHSEIEKRRRDKMNTYITELSAIVPMCGAMARKLDKLTVLRMAVQHLRSVRGALSACPLTARPRPAYLSERELNSLIMKAADDCFLLVVGCDRGRLLYVSASVKNMLHFDQSELLGQSLFDILHPKDVAKVKEQLSSSDLSPRERLIDAKTMLPVKADLVAGTSRLCPGARRSFSCRIKCRTPDANGTTSSGNSSATGTGSTVKEDPESAGKHRKKHANEKKYCVVQCTGYLKSWAPAEMSEGGEGGDDGDACNLSCLVAVGRALPEASPAPPPTRSLQYVSRHATDGKFLFVDQRVTMALGFLPQELLGTSLYEYVGGGGNELGAVARAHKASLLRRASQHTPPYAFRRKDGSYARIQTHFKPFRNPWTKDVECLVANNSLVPESAPHRASDSHASFIYKHTRDGTGSEITEADLEMQRLIDSQVESHKIGSAIAEEALRCSSAELSPDLPADLLQDAVFNQQCLSTNVMYQQASLVDNILGVDMAPYQVRNNVPLSVAGGPTSPPGTIGPIATAPSSPSPPLPPLGLDGNGEAAMAVIMSLLEADAGLGGPVNFSGLPWPLP